MDHTEIVDRCAEILSLQEEIRHRRKTDMDIVRGLAKAKKYTDHHDILEKERQKLLQKLTDNDETVIGENGIAKIRTRTIYEPTNEEELKREILDSGFHGILKLSKRDLDMLVRGGKKFTNMETVEVKKAVVRRSDIYILQSRSQSIGKEYEKIEDFFE